MINLEIPSKLRPLVEQARLVAENVFRPISRKYDSAEHAYPKELDMLAALLDGVNDGGAGASANRLEKRGGNGANMAAVLGIYARENGQGMVFEAEAPRPSPDDEPRTGKPSLRVVK